MKIYITSFVPESSLKMLRKAAWEIIYEPHVQIEELKENLGDVDGIIINTKTPMDKEVLENNSHLKFIGRLGSGLDIIDLEVASKCGIRVFNSPEGNCNAVAEHALSMILGFYNKLFASDAMVRKGEWNRELMRGEEIGSKTIGIIGYGHTGTALANKLSGFGSKIKYYDPYVLKVDPRLSLERAESVQDICSTCDIISFHVPLTSETTYMGNEEFFTSCKRKPLIVNTSRGGVINTLHLLSALENGNISGACLDVFENEKPESYSEKEKEMYSILFKNKNVILSPHVAGWSQFSKIALSEILFDKILHSFS